MQNSKAKNQHSATNNEVLKAVNNLANKTDRRFNDIYEVVSFIKDNAVMSSEFENKMAKFEGRLNKMENKMATKEDLAKMASKEDLEKTECRLVTKSYLDDKLADVVSEIGSRINRVKEKGKVFNQKLVGFLDKHTTFETSEINELKELI